MSVPAEPVLPIEDVQAICSRAGVHGPVAVTPLQGGRNNRVYRISAGPAALLLKSYFPDAAGSRDRLTREFSFTRHAWSNGIRQVAEPFAADYDRNLALYAFVAGTRLRLEDVTADHVNEAARFYRTLNERRSNAAGLMPAAEACFSIAAHLGTVDRRVERLDGISAEDDDGGAAAMFVKTELRPLWEEARSIVAAVYRRSGLLNAELEQSSRCLSPSDFGFHNALAGESGVVTFLDFEYAGWDDPAKLVCDFANQPDMLLPEPLSERFRQDVITSDASPTLLAERIAWLRPVYQIKWSCIILNEFLPRGSNRARFTGASGDVSARKATQLEKARRMLASAKTSLARTSQ